MKRAIQIKKTETMIHFGNVRIIDLERHIHFLLRLEVNTANDR